jgi:NADPH:quinone reductase-like Zn-dependent oxidoreductase
MERKVHHPLKTDRGLRARMKAIRIHEYGGVGTLKLEEVARISITDDQVLVRIEDAGVNPVDWKVRQGHL